MQPLLPPGDNFINISLELFCQYFLAKKLQSQNITREKLRKAFLYEKRVRKMLMKSTPDSDSCQ